MRTKRKKEVIFADEPVEPVIEIASGDLSESKKERFQLSFDLNEDGTPDLTSMRGRTKEKVQAFFSDPNMAKAFGAKAPAQPEVQVFHPAMVAGLYSMLGSVEALVVSRMSKIPEPICKQVFTYTPAEIEALSVPTVRVLNKYAADWMIRYQDEIALVTLLTSITITKFNMAAMMAKMEQRNTPQAVSQAKSDGNGEKEGAGTSGPVQ